MLGIQTKSDMVRTREGHVMSTLVRGIFGNDQKQNYDGLSPERPVRIQRIGTIGRRSDNKS